MKTDENLKQLKKFAASYKEQLGIYGIRLRIEVDPDFVPDPDTDDVQLYRILVNDKVFSNLMTEDETKNDIVGLAETFNIFKALPSRFYEKIMFDREVERIKKQLRSWDDKSYDFFPNELDFDEDEEEDACPSIRAYIDELSITDSNIHSFLVHKVTMDENDNIKLIGKIQGDAGYYYGEDELYTTLGSVLPSDMELIQVPVCDETKNIINETTEENGKQTEE